MMQINIHVLYEWVVVVVADYHVNNTHTHYKNIDKYIHMYVKRDRIILTAAAYTGGCEDERISIKAVGMSREASR